ncbi:hypothetical protein ACVRW4_02235 [Streptococcus phocae subsp. phocae]|uniref:Uncharacterized protein n=1 Tax=Streptococcus phocae TaxID=119224 RepID=A0A0P6SJU2_9STRE|nr:hypothetical protein [Streptococcus phocae]KPJ21710.1 hypothetical protein AKK44_08475 [Streptococcus phocae]
MKKTLFLSAAALMLASTAALSTHSVSASSYYDNPSLLRQNGTQTDREARNGAELEIRNLLQQYGVTDTDEYNSYYTFYYRKARRCRKASDVKQVIDELEKNLQETQNDID